MLSKYTGYSPVEKSNHCVVGVVRVLPKKAIFLLTDFCRVAPEPQPFVSLCFTSGSTGNYEFRIFLKLSWAFS